MKAIAGFLMLAASGASFATCRRCHGMSRVYRYTSLSGFGKEFGRSGCINMKNLERRATS